MTEDFGSEEKEAPERFQIIKEIVSSEKKYVEQLNILCSLYIVPLEASLQTNPIIDEETINYIFGNLTVIKQLNTNFFHKLNTRLANWNKDSTIGDIFVDFAPFFKMYMSYVNNHEKASKVIKEELKANTRFNTFCQATFLNPLTQQQTLESFLILPIQRLPRYLLLIKDLLKKTKSGHIDYENLNKAYNSLLNVTQQINTAIKEHENRSKIYEIQESFLENVNFLMPSRKYVYEGYLTKLCRNKAKKYIFYLFSDLLVYASKSAGLKLKLHREIKINEAFNVKDLSDEGDIKNCFQLMSSNKSFKVFADSPEHKEIWMKHLNEAIAGRNITNDQLTTLSEAPVWQQDFESKTCKLCKVKFSIFRRRHHCRRCGVLVCDMCSKNRELIKGIGDNTFLRICNNCAKIRSAKAQDSVNNDKKTMAVSRSQPLLLGLEVYKSDKERKINIKESDVEKVEFVSAKYNYNPVQENELKFSRNDIIAVVNKDRSGWWTGILNKKVGVFPSNFTLPHKSNQKKNRLVKSTSSEQIKSPTMGKCTEKLGKVRQLEENSGLTCGVSKYKNSNTKNKMLKTEIGDQLLVKPSDVKVKGDDILYYAKNIRSNEWGWVKKEWLNEPVNSKAETETNLSLDCQCKGFKPNAFRPALCSDCFHNKMSHI